MSTGASTCYRFPVAPQRSAARLFFRGQLVDAHLKDRSAIGFGILVESGIRLEVNAVFPLQTVDGCFQVHVVAIEPNGELQFCDLERLGELNRRSKSSKLLNRGSSESLIGRFGRATRIDSVALCGLLCVSMILMGIYLGMGKSRVKTLFANGKRAVTNYFQTSGSAELPPATTSQRSISNSVSFSRNPAARSYSSIGNQDKADQRAVARLIGKTDLSWSEVAATLNLSDEQSREIFARLSHEPPSPDAAPNSDVDADGQSIIAQTEIVAAERAMLQDVESMMTDKQLQRLANLRTGHAERF